MALPEAAGGVEAAVPKDRIGGLTWFARLAIAPPLAIALACVFVVVNEVGYRTVSGIAVNRDNAIEARVIVERLRANIVAAESAQRGLMLTERPIYREGLELSLANVTQSISDIQRVAANRPQDAKAMSELVELAGRKVSELRETLRQLGAGNRAGALELMLSDIGREQMAAVDSSVAALTLAQDQEMESTGELRDSVLLYSRFGMLGLVLSCLAAVLTTLYLLRHREVERLSYLNALRAERDKLEKTVSSRTDELSDLTRHLQTVREDERSHLARELHDELGGLLTAAKLDLARMRSRLAQSGPEVAERMAHLHSTLDAGIALKRRIIEDLRPSSLANLGLGLALRILCQEWSGASGIAVDVALEEVTLPPEHALVVYRLVQEALTNTAKYAEASDVRVKLSQGDGVAVVQVQDDGCGFATAQRASGHGLAGMRFRVASIGGELTVTSAPGQGTTIRAQLPLQA